MLVLRRISVQLESFSLPPGFANSSSTTPPLPSLNFVADSATRWINALWFLSLIFSLAAALFGILVKQWIREYMQWNYTLAPPRDNVLVRQIRFEAWNNWNVPATIASIPALLEIALVLFVCGLVILLWTLDPVVSTVITTAVAVFLAIASTFTILPSFFKRCPYKSPTAWVFAVVWDVATLWIPHMLSRPLYSLGCKLGRRYITNRVGDLGWWMARVSGHKNWRLGNWNAISSGWRVRDLADVWSSFAPDSNLKRGDATALLDALISERSCADGAHECTEERVTIALWPDAADRADALFPLHDALCTITELPPLVRALAWVSQASQEVSIQRTVSHCVESLESRFVWPKPMIRTYQGGWALTQEGVYAISIWHLAVSSGRAYDLTADEYQRPPKDVTAFRASNVQYSTCPHICKIGRGHSFPTTLYRINLGIYTATSATEHSPPAISILVFLSALSFRSIFEGHPAISRENIPSTLRSARRAMELLTALYSFCELRKSDPYIENAVKCVVDVLHATDGDQRQSFDFRFPNLRECMRKVARDLGGLDFSDYSYVAHPTRRTENVRSVDLVQSSSRSERVAMPLSGSPSMGLEESQLSRGGDVEPTFCGGEAQVKLLRPDLVQHPPSSKLASPYSQAPFADVTAKYATNATTEPSDGAASQCPGRDISQDVSC